MARKSYIDLLQEVEAEMERKNQRQTKPQIKTQNSYNTFRAISNQAGVSTPIRKKKKEEEKKITFGENEKKETILTVPTVEEAITQFKPQEKNWYEGFFDNVKGVGASVAYGVTEGIGALGTVVKENLPSMLSNKVSTRKALEDYEATHGITPEKKEELLNKYIKEYGDGNIDVATTKLAEQYSEKAEKLKLLGGLGQFQNPKEYEQLEKEVAEIEYARDVLQEKRGKKPFTDDIFETMKGTLDFIGLGEAIEGVGDELATPFDQVEELGENTVGTSAQKFGQEHSFVGGLAQSVGGLIPAMVATALTKNTAVGSAVFTASAKGSYYENYVERGYSRKEAEEASTLMAGVELGTEFLGGWLGGVNVFKSGALKEIAEKSGVQTIKALGVEGIEEATAELANIGIDMDLGEDITLEEAGERIGTAFASGVALGVVMKGAGVAGSKAQALAQKINNNEQVTETELVEALEEVAEQENTTVEALLENEITEMQQNTEQETVKEQENAETEKIEAPQAEISDFSEQEQQVTLPEVETAQNNIVEPNTAVDQEIAPVNVRNVAESEENTKNVAESDLKKQNFTYQAQETDSEIKKSVYESASKVMNNTEAAHKFADVVAKLAEERNTTYKFTNSKQLNDMGYKVKKGTINGLVTENNEVLINVESKKMINAVLGHETTHLLEGTKEYEALKEIAIKFAKTNGEYQTRLDNLTELYKGKNADIEAELTADIVGDYLFTNEQFVQELSVQKPTLFQKIKNLINDLVVKFKGTEQEKQLRELQRKFEKAYKQEVGQTNTDVRYSISATATDNQGRILTKEQQEFFKYSKVRDENGNLITVYHGTQNGGFTQFKSYSYFTDNNDVARTYSGSIENITKDTFDAGRRTSIGNYEGYINLTEPFEIDLNGSNWDEIDINKIDIPNIQELLNENGISTYEKDGKIYIGTDDIVSIVDSLNENGANYDGIIMKNIYDNGSKANNNNALSNDYIIFNKNQFKSVDNTNPTSNPDIRYSLSNKNDIAPTGDYQVTSEDIALEIAPVKEVAESKQETSKITEPVQVEDDIAPVESEDKKQIQVYNAVRLDEKNANLDAEAKPHGLFLSNLYETDFNEFESPFARQYEGGERHHYKVEPKNPLVVKPLVLDNAKYKYRGDGMLARLDADASLSALKELVSEQEFTKVSEMSKQELVEYLNNKYSQYDFSNYYDKAELLMAYGSVEARNQGYDAIITERSTDPDTADIDNEIVVLKNDILKTEAEATQQGTPTAEEIDNIIKLKEEGGQKYAKAYYDAVDKYGHTAFYKALNEGYVRAKNQDIAPIVQETIAPLQETISELTEQVGKLTDLVENAALNNATLAENVADTTLDQQVEGNNEPTGIVEDTTPDVLDDKITKTTVESPFENRDIKEVGNRKVKAYMYENPEVKPYFQKAANEMLGDLKNTIKGERVYNPELAYQDGTADQNGAFGWVGIKRQSTEDISYLIDNFGYTYAQIEEGLNKIIEDNGLENNAVSKRIEFALNDRLLNGYVDVSGVPIPANQEYVNLIEGKNITEYNSNKFADMTDDEMVQFLENATADFLAEDETDIPIAENTVETATEDAETVVNNRHEEIIGGETKELTREEKAADFLKTTAAELHQELNNLKKGVRASERLGNLLDYGYSWNELKRAFAYIERSPAKRLNPNFDAEGLVRDILVHEFEDIMEEEAATEAMLHNQRVKTMQENSVQQQWNEEGELVDTEPVEKKTKGEIQRQLIEDAGIVKESLDNAKDVSKVLMHNTDPIRLQEIIFGKELGGKINDAIFQTVKHNTAEKIRFQNQERNEIKELGIKPRSKESAAVQKYGEKQYVNEAGETVAYKDAELAAEFPEVETQEKIKNAAKVIRQKYDTYIDMVNAEITKYGYEAIPKRQDYMRHFQELNDVFSRYGLPFNMQSAQANDLPVDINGLTADLKPGKNWFSSALRRKGNKTTYDAITGIDGYIEGIGNLIYHTKDIQTLRGFEDYVREMYGQENGFDNLDNLSDEEKAVRLQQIQNNHLGNYAAWLREYTNALAGKKAMVDRAVEDIFGRRVYSFLNELKSQVGSNMTGLNIGSALTNPISMTQALAKTNKLATVKGYADTIKNIFIKDNFVEQNDFLTARFGSDLLSPTAWQKMRNAGQIFMTGTDWFASNSITRSKFYELKAQGLSDAEAHKQAGEFAAKILGDRSQGATPTLYNSKMLGLVTQFQLEVNNQLYSQFYDTFSDAKQTAKEKGVLKAAAGATFVLGQLAAFQHIYNDLYEAIAGRRPAFDILAIIATALGIGGDDEEEKKPLGDRLYEATDMLLDSLPYVSVITGGGRIPISEALPITELISGKDEYGNEKSRLETLSEALPYYFLPTGYGQIKKTVTGLGMYDDELPIAGSYTNSGNLRFTAEEDGWSKLQAGIFGQWANPNAKAYIDSDFKTIAKENIDELVELGYDSKEYNKYKTGLNEIKKMDLEEGDARATHLFDYIESLNATDKQKSTMIKNLLSDEEVEALNGLSMTAAETIEYYEAKSNISQQIAEYTKDKKLVEYDVDSEEYKEAISGLSNDKKAKIIDTILDAEITDEQKAYLYGKYYSSDKTLDKITSAGVSMNDFLTFSKDSLSLEDNYEKAEYLYNANLTERTKTVLYETTLSGFDDEEKYKDYKTAKAAGIDINSWLSYKKQEFRADKDKYGDSISGTKKRKVINHINSLNLSIPQKALLIRTEYESFDDYNYDIVKYVDGLDTTYDAKVTILENIGMTVDSNGYIGW